MDEQLDIIEQQASIKDYEKSILIKLSVLFGVSTILLILSVVFMAIGGGKFSSKNITGLLIGFQIIAMLLSLGLLSYHLLSDVKLSYYEKYYKVYDIVQFVLVALIVFFFLQTFIFKNARVTGSSMEPTLHNGDMVFVMQIHDKYKINDVIVMNAVPDLDVTTFNPKPTISSEGYYVKRIKAAPGQKIAYVETESGLAFYVDEQLIQTITNLNHQLIIKHIVDVNDGVVPKDQFLVLGDNVDNSKDSRVFGLVHRRDILGIVKIRFLKKPGLVK